MPWRGEPDAGAYADRPGFCRTVTLEEIRGHGHVLTPGRYVGTKAPDRNTIPFPEQLAALGAILDEQFADSERLAANIRENLTAILKR